MAVDYFYSSAGRQAGPVPIEQLRAMALQGELKRTDKVWCESMPSWVPAAELPGLFDGCPPDLFPLNPTGVESPPQRREARPGGEVRLGLAARSPRSEVAAHSLPATDSPTLDSFRRKRGWRPRPAFTLMGCFLLSLGVLLAIALNRSATRDRQKREISQIESEICREIKEAVVGLGTDRYGVNELGNFKLIQPHLNRAMESALALRNLTERSGLPTSMEDIGNRISTALSWRENIETNHPTGLLTRDQDEIKIRARANFTFSVNWMCIEAGLPEPY